MKKLKYLLPLLFIILQSSVAFGADWNTVAHVTLVEGTYLPNKIPFLIDQPAGTCPARTWITWVGQGSNTADQQSNTKAIYALLLTAISTGNSISVFGSYGSGNCQNLQAQYLHIYNQK